MRKDSATSCASTGACGPAGGGIAARGLELLVLDDDGRIAADDRFIDPTPSQTDAWRLSAVAFSAAASAR